MHYLFKILTFVCSIATAGLMMRGLDFFWITAILTLICAGFAMQDEDEFIVQFDSKPDLNTSLDVDDWEEDKAWYEEPNGEIVWKDDNEEPDVDDCKIDRTLPSSEYVDGKGKKLYKEGEELPF